MDPVNHMNLISVKPKLATFLGSNDRVEKLNTQRNSWSYKRGKFLGRSKKSFAHVWKQKCVRKHRCSTRSVLSKDELDETNTGRHKDAEDAWGSPNDADVGSRSCTRSRCDSFITSNFQRNVVERNAISSYRRGVKRLPFEQIEHTGEREDNIRSLGWDAPDLPHWSKHNQHHEEGGNYHQYKHYNECGHRFQNHGFQKYQHYKTKDNVDCNDVWETTVPFLQFMYNDNICENVGEHTSDNE